MSEHGIHSAIVTVVNSISLANISQLLLQYLFLLKGRRGGVIIGAEGLKGGGERERYWDRMQPQAYKALHCMETALLNTPSVTHFSPTFPSSAARFSAYPPIFLVLPFPLPTPPLVRRRRANYCHGGIGSTWRPFAPPDFPHSAAAHANNPIVTCFVMALCCC